MQVMINTSLGCLKKKEAVMDHMLNYRDVYITRKKSYLAFQRHFPYILTRFIDQMHFKY